MNSAFCLTTIASLTAAACLALAAPALAASPDTTAAHQCSTDLTAFDGQLRKDGYWLHGDGFGYGYPMYGYGYYYGVPPMVATSNQESHGYSHARPGYEVRTLLASADILAQRGDQGGCENLLGSARNLYSGYAAELRSGHVPRADVAGWRRQQIANAVSVKGSSLAFRSDQLVGAAVVNPRGDDLGSVDDIVMSPRTGEIVYLVIARGGIFGFDRTFLPIPWEDFKAAAGNQLLVLDTVKAAMDAAPQVRKDENFQHAAFAAESLKVDAYWVAHLPPLAVAPVQPTSGSGSAKN
jgi:sporulation protein YlmC with PRC-barrel domain